MQSLPVRFVVRFTALPGRGEWEAMLRPAGPDAPDLGLATATGASPEAALKALLPMVGRRAGHTHHLAKPVAR